jgi:hypothetical protein
MPNVPILDVAIGLVFVYLLLAFLCATVNEAIASLQKRRARFLDEGLYSLFGSQELKDEFYKHPLIRPLAPRPRPSSIVSRGMARLLGQPAGQICPSYIPAELFAAAARDLLTTRAPQAAENPTGQTGDLREALAYVRSRGDESAEALEAHLRRLFDATMDRVSGWYKRHAQAWSLTLAAIVTLVLNVDTLRTMRVLWTNPTLRAVMVAAALERSNDGPAPASQPTAPQADGSQPAPVQPLQLTAQERELLDELTGWSDDWADFQRRVQARQAAAALPALGFGEKVGVFWPWLGGVLWAHGLGWLMTAIAVSMGAPFWFDVLKKFMNVRNSGPRPDERAPASAAAARPSDGKA